MTTMDQPGAGLPPALHIDEFIAGTVGEGWLALIEDHLRQTGRLSNEDAPDVQAILFALEFTVERLPSAALPKRSLAQQEKI